MAFTYDITTDRGEVRFLLTDTSSETAAFNDAEIDHALSKEGSVYGAVGRLARVLMTDRARRARAYQVEGEAATYDDAAQIAALEKLVSMYGSDTPRLKRVTIGTMGAHASDPTSTG